STPDLGVPDSRVSHTPALRQVPKTARLRVVRERAVCRMGAAPLPDMEHGTCALGQRCRGIADDRAALVRRRENTGLVPMLGGMALAGMGSLDADEGAGIRAGRRMAPRPSEPRGQIEERSRS